MTPVVVIGNQIEARGKRTVRTDKGTISSGPTVPWPQTAPHSFLEGLEVLDGIDHGPAMALFVDKEI